MGLMRTVLAALVVVAAGAAQDDERAYGFLDEHCLGCHSGRSPEGALSLERLEVEFGDDAAAGVWARLADRVERLEMPPPGEGRGPSADERHAFVTWIRDQLVARDPVGGAGPRRLARREYEATISDLFGMSYSLPESFPHDHSPHGFDNVASDLRASFPLVREVLEQATAIADRLFPPQRADVALESRTLVVAPAELEQPARLDDDLGRVRLTLFQNLVAAACAWPSRFDAPTSGRYRVTVEASAFMTAQAHVREAGTTRRLGLFARPSDDATITTLDGLRPLAELLVEGTDPQQLSADVVLYAGETVAFAWVDSPVYSVPGRHDLHRDVLVKRLEESPEFLAAWTAIGYEDRGTDGNIPVNDYYREFMALAESLPTGTRLQQRVLDMARREVLREAQGVRVLNVMRVEFTRFGPALDIHGVVIEGPLERIDDVDVLAAKRAAAALIGDRTDLDNDATLVAVVERFLPRAFRRPLEAATRDEYLALGRRAMEAGGRLEDGLHAVVRTALTSPRFLFRGLSGRQLDEHDLAARLSYFLTGGPPDDTLRSLAERGTLRPALGEQARRLLASPQSARFIDAFTAGWLGTERLHHIMPDGRLFDVERRDIDAMADEARAFFSTVLADDLPAITLIDPDFTFMNEGLARRVYGVGGVSGDDLQRVEVPRGGRIGGVLGMAAVMMATANGVDTQPVLRGVWVLDAVLGDRPGAPPEDVPALGSDTSGAVDVREQLARHRAATRCASCHTRIDPLGHVLENFDPVGRWRTHYPQLVTLDDGTTRVEPGAAVVARVTLADGTEIADVCDLKRYLVEHDERFVRALTGKLLTFATGRTMTHGDERVIADLVERVSVRDGGLRELIGEAVLSEVFATR